MQTPDFKDIANHFSIDGTLVGVEPLSIGHINDTLIGTFAGSSGRFRLLHQRINHNVFHKPPELMDNLQRVTAHVRGKLVESGAADVDRRVLTVVPACEGNSFWRDAAGNYWRTFNFIERSRSYDTPPSPRHVYAAAKAFGEFHAMLADFPVDSLHDTIPDFHHTPKRFQTFVDAVNADSHGRAKSASREIDFVMAHEPLTRKLLDAHAAGEVPLRVTHNDTKINNVLFDTESDEAICIVDLDTVMPGLSLYDVGDLIRTATSRSAEDERDLSRVAVDPAFYRAIVEGYTAAMQDRLTAGERRLLLTSGKVITLEIGIRFLTDYLSGDTYYKIHRLNHNLDRCRTQFKLVQSLTDNEAALSS